MPDHAYTGKLITTSVVSSGEHRHARALLRSTGSEQSASQARTEVSHRETLHIQPNGAARACAVQPSRPSARVEP